MASPKSSNNTLMAILCYFGILVIVPFLTDAKNDPFVKYHIKQGLVLLIADVALGFIYAMPFIGWLCSLVVFIWFLMGVINAAGGKTKPLPVIGQFAEKINI